MSIHSSASTDFTHLNSVLEPASPAEIIRWATATYAPNLALTCSFGGSSGMVLLDLLLRVNRDIPVLVLDTDVLFDETYRLIDTVERHYGIAVQRIRPTLSLEQQAAQHGPDLHAHEPDRCCAIRKVEPLARALKPYAAWMTALRRDQSSTRASTPVVSWNTKHNLVKICPLATWTDRDVWRYINEHGVPYNPLLDQGYASLGCHTCTSHPLNGDPRSGRWVGFAKTECGLHG